MLNINLKNLLSVCVLLGTVGVACTSTAPAAAPAPETEFATSPGATGSLEDEMTDLSWADYKTNIPFEEKMRSNVFTAKEDTRAPAAYSMPTAKAPAKTTHKTKAAKVSMNVKPSKKAKR